jgi:hypothetical protein
MASLELDPLADYEPASSVPATTRECAPRGIDPSDLADAAREADALPASSVPLSAAERPFRGHTYQALPEGYFCITDAKGEAQPPRQLSNWTARIVEEVLIDDGGPAPKRTLIMDVSTIGRSRRVSVPASRFPSIRDWLPDALGSAAQTAVMPRVFEHLLQAMLQTNRNVPEQVRYRHCGWRQIDGVPVFLHSGGGVGPSGPINHLSVELPDALKPLSLPVPSSDEEERRAIRWAISLLSLAGMPVTAPLLGAVWRAPLGESQLAVWITGATGAGKTELTAIAQQHFGAGFDAQHMPAAWSGTANSINELAYLAKDIVLTVDDFVPKGPAQSVARLHAVAETVIRAQGNASGRSRLDSDAQLRDARPPRGTLLASGEDIPEGQSLRARMLVVDLAPRELDFERLTVAQGLARQGILATAVGGYIRWLAGNPDRLPSVRADVEKHRVALLGIGAHRRTASLLAEAAHGWRTFLDYAHDRGALPKNEADQWWTDLTAALRTCGEQQSATDNDADPASQFVNAIGSALSAGRAHLATPSGTTPTHPERWGWRVEGNGVSRAWREGGPRIGWVEGDDIYLLPDMALEIARQGTAEPISLGKSTLAKRLHERKVLLAGELEGRGTYTVRRKIQGRRLNTWHFRARSLGVTGHEDGL